MSIGSNTPQRNLVHEITGILTKIGHPAPSVWQAGVHADAFNHEEEGIRRFQINQYWREALGNVDISGQGNTIGERFCLIEDGSIDDWLRLFEKEVSKAIMKFQIGFPTH